MTFQLDTTGMVDGPEHDPEDYYHWSDLTPFTQGYIEAMFADHWRALAAELNEQWLRQQKDRDWKLHPSWRRGWLTVGFSDLAPETLARIIADCEADQKVGARMNLAGSPEDRTSFDAGRRYWKERQTGNLFDAPPLTVQLGDDGKVRFAEPAR